MKNHDHALALLEQVANSLFFALDRAYGIAIMLERTRTSLPHVMTTRSYGEGPFSIDFPRDSFDNQAMSSYWYARSAPDMPLLQYLAYYQAIESFFPRFSKQRAVQQVQTIIKDPTFSAHKEHDVVRLINALQSVGVVVPETSASSFSPPLMGASRTSTWGNSSPLTRRESSSSIRIRSFLARAFASSSLTERYLSLMLQPASTKYDAGSSTRKPRRPYAA
jgi:hypothetical protein